MVAKIYFPDALERTESTDTAASTTTAAAAATYNDRSYNYRRVNTRTNFTSATTTRTSRIHTASGLEVEDEEDGVEIIHDDDDDDDDDHSTMNTLRGDKNTFESDSSFDEDYNFIAEQQALVDGDLAPIVNTKRLIGRKTHKDVTSKASSLVDTFAFEQEQSSKHMVLRRLFICVISLNVTFIIWGVLQERMLTRRYPRYTGEFFTYSYALVFTNRFWTLIMSSILLVYFKPKRSSSTVIYEYAFPSISNMLSSWCQYESLRYVSFPAVTLFKSFKLAPVMAMGKFLGNKQCEFFLLF
jgi:hypothetical protein